MDYRSLCAGAVLVVTGCFSEPPSATSGSGGSSSSGDAADSTTSEVADSGSSTGFDCVPSNFEPDHVPADVVVLIDEDVQVSAGRIALAVGQLENNPLGNNVAVLAPDGFLGEQLPFDPDCAVGCAGGCGPDPSRVVVSYTEGPVAALADAVSWNCILRPAPPSSDASGPARHLWWITPDGGQVLSKALVDAVRGSGFRFHAACPGCDANSVSGSVAALVEETIGTYSDSSVLPTDPDSPEAQARQIAADRYSCTWSSDHTPEEVLLTPEGADDEDTVVSPVDNGAHCSELEGTGVPAFYPEALFSGAGFAMCPAACQALQAFPAAQLEMAECLLD